jgi:WS/DGAT/MGAT family acyltransferase
MYQINSEDANFLYLENTDSPTHISLVYLYDQTDMGGDVVRFTHIREHIENRLYSAPVFRQKLHRVPADIDYPYWVDDNSFDLDYHVRHLALPKPGDWRQFCIQIARLHSRPLDTRRPLWELYVIEGLDHLEGFPADSFALYFKVHHCAMDEFTARELLESLHSTVPDKTQHKSAMQHIALLSADPPTHAEMLKRSAVNNASKSLRLYWQVLTNLQTVSRIMIRLTVRAVQKRQQGADTLAAQRNRFGGPLGSSRVFEGRFYPIAAMNRYVESVSGAKLTHAIAAVCGEALRRYLEAHGELQDDAALSAWVEANIRNPGAHALAGNRIALKRIDLYSNIEHPVDRLLAIVATNKELRSEKEEALTSFKLRSLYENVPSPALALLGKYANRQRSPAHRLAGSANCGISEVHGSSHELYMLGARLLGFTSVSPLYSGCGLIFTASTYLDTIGITFTSDSSMMPDPEFMQECLKQAFAQLDTLEADTKRRTASRQKHASA